MPTWTNQHNKQRVKEAKKIWIRHQTAPFRFRSNASSAPNMRSFGSEHADVSGPNMRTFQSKHMVNLPWPYIWLSQDTYVIRPCHLCDLCHEAICNRSSLVPIRENSQQIRSAKIFYFQKICFSCHYFVAAPYSSGLQRVTGKWQVTAISAKNFP